MKQSTPRGETAGWRTSSLRAEILRGPYASAQLQAERAPFWDATLAGAAQHYVR